jgi:predicted membrane-bound spermidine synthase
MTYTLLISVFIIASCGLVYELIAGTLSSYLLGDSVTQLSTVIGVKVLSINDERTPDNPPRSLPPPVAGRVC